MGILFMFQQINLIIEISKENFKEVPPTTANLFLKTDQVNFYDSLPYDRSKDGFTNKGGNYSLWGNSVLLHTDNIT